MTYGELLIALLMAMLCISVYVIFTLRKCLAEFADKLIKNGVFFGPAWESRRCVFIERDICGSLVGYPAPHNDAVVIQIDSRVRVGIGECMGSIDVAMGQEQLDFFWHSHKEGRKLFLFAFPLPVSSKKNARNNTNHDRHANNEEPNE
jgi:hypothetical protein